MIWLVVLGLGLWCLLQQDKLNSLVKQITGLRTEIARLIAEAPVETRKTTAVPQTVHPVFVDLSPAHAPLPPVEAAKPLPEPAMAAIIEAATQAGPAKLAAKEPGSRGAADWLSEKGLAWIGGGALALGGLFLVAYAAQRGLFGPPMRIGAAVVLGFAAIGGGEALRRGIGGREPNRLVAGVTTGAGAVILYGAIWAAYRLYGFIPAGGAAILLAGVSFGLLGLALLHGEAIAVVAIAAANLAPVICTTPDFPKAPLDIFVGLILATGIAIASLRRWTVAALVTMAGAELWALALVIERDYVGAAALALAIPALTLGGLFLPEKPVAKPEDPLRPVVPLFSIAVALGGFIVWFGAADRSSLGFSCAMLALAGVAACVAIEDWRWRRSRLTLLAPVIAVGLTTLGQPLTAADVPWLILALLANAGAGCLGSSRASAPREPAIIGAVGAAVTMTLLIAPLARTAAGWDWAIDASVATLLAAGAAGLALRSKSADVDLASGAWIASTAEVAGLALHAGLDFHATPIAYGVFGLGLAGLAFRLRWRGFAESAAVACLASFAALLQPTIVSAVMTDPRAWLIIGAVSAGAVLAQTAAWLALKAKRDSVGAAEAISTLAVLTGLLGAFLVLQTFGQATYGGPLVGDFTRASIRTILLLAAGLMLTLRDAATPIGRYRAPALLVLGAVHGLLFEALRLNPFWGFGDQVTGPPLFDSLLLGLLAPALLLGAAARRAGERRERTAIPGFALGITFLALWIICEIRRLFHGTDLHAGPLTHAEIAAYGVAILAVAALLDLGRLKLNNALSRQPRSTALGEVLGVFGWIGLGVSFYVLAFIATPWWGPLTVDLTLPGVFFVLYGAAIALNGGLAILARRDKRKALATATLVAAAVELLVLLTLVIRFVFHGGAMREPLHEASLETWSFSATWALYGLIMLSVGAFRKDGPLRFMGLGLLLLTTAKVFLFDLGHLEGVVRAASFLALGAILLIAALAARRFGAVATLDDGA